MKNKNSTAAAARAAVATKSTTSASLHGRHAGILLALLGSVAAGRSQAQVESYQPAAAFRSLQGYIALDAGMLYTDNAVLTQSGRVSDGIARTGLDIDYTRKGSMLDLDAHGTVDSIEYVKHTFDRSIYGALDASALWGKSTNLLQWLVRDSFGEATANPYGAPTPVNLETLNYFTTGPFLNLPLGAQNRMTLFGSYSSTAYQRSPYDSNSFTEGASLAHGLSASSSVALQATAQEFRFKNTAVATNYNVHSAFLEYTGELARTRAKLDGGYVQLLQAGTRTGGPLIGFELDRRISFSTTVYLRGRTDYTSAGQSLVDQVSTPAPAASVPATATAAPYRDRLLALGWTTAGTRTTLSFLGSVERENYIGQSKFDQRDTNIEGVLERQVRPAVSAKLTARQTFESYANSHTDIKETLVNVSLAKAFNRGTATFYYQRRHHSGSGEVSSLVANFDEDEVGLDFTYYLVGRP